MKIKFATEQNHEMETRLTIFEQTTVEPKKKTNFVTPHETTL